MYQCPACGSHDFKFLGSLGNREYLRCYDCGIDYSHDENAEEWEEPDEDYGFFDDIDDGDVGLAPDEDYGSFSDIEDY